MKSLASSVNYYESMLFVILESNIPKILPIALIFYSLSAIYIPKRHFKKAKNHSNATERSKK